MGSLYGIDVYYIHQQEVLFYYLVLFLITSTLLGFVRTLFCSNYRNCLHDSFASIKLNLVLAMMWEDTFLDGFSDWRIGQ